MRSLLFTCTLSACLFSLLMPAQGHAQPLTHKYLRSADKAYLQDDWTLAEENYRKAIFHDTTGLSVDSSSQYLPKEFYNLGNALYLQQRYEEALKAYQNAFLLGDKQLKLRALFNLGNTFYALEKYQEAAEAFKEVLRQQTGYPDAAYNLAQSLRKLKEQQQKEQQQQDQKDQKDENQKDKEQQNQDQQKEQQQDQKDQNQEQQQQQQDQQQKKEQEKQSQQDTNQQDTKQQQQQEQQQQQQQGQENKQQQQAGQGRQEQAKKLTREEALQLLRIMQEEEMKVQKGKRKFKGTHNKSDKDW